MTKQNVNKKNLIWVASYPKSGNTWVRFILQAAVTGKVDLKTIGQLVPNFAVMNSAVNADISVQMPAEARRYWPKTQTALNNETKSPLFLKTHNVCAAFDSGQFPDPKLSIGGIYVVRDPRDLVLSYRAHFGLTIDEAIDYVRDKDNFIFNAKDNLTTELISSWDQHYQSWKQAPFPMHLMKYEDLLQNPEANINKMLAFLKLKPVISVSKILELTSFNSLATKEKTDGFSEASSKTTRFFRKGTKGQWRDHSSEISPLKEHFKATFDELGYR